MAKTGLKVTYVVLITAVAVITAVCLTIALWPSDPPRGVSSPTAPEETERIPVGWSGEYDISWYDPQYTSFTLSTAEQLAGFARLVAQGNDFSGTELRLSANIVINANVLTPELSLNEGSFKTFPVIGTSGAPFAGVFDGADFDIIGLYSNGTDDYALFFTNNGTLKKLNVTDSYIRGNTVSGLCLINNGTVDNCSFSGSLTAADQFCGGICGDNRNTVINCRNYGNISGTSGLAGGIAGANRSSGAFVRNCSNAGVISGGTCVGGIVGKNFEADTAVEYCCNEGAVNGNYSTGGICGANVNGTVGSCYNIGNISVNFSDSNYGGITGEEEYGSVTVNCYYLEGTAPGGIFRSDFEGKAVSKTADEFMNGEVCDLLNAAGEHEIWKQIIGKDAYPKLNFN